MTEPGYYRGRLFVTYVDEVKRLKRNGKSGNVILLLSHLCEAAEEWAVSEGLDVPTWYHWHLAVEYRKIKDYGSEISVIERFLAHKHHPIADTEFRRRLDKALCLKRA